MCAIAELDRERAVIVGRDDVAHPRPQLAGRTRGLDERLLVDLLQVASQYLDLEREHLEQQAQRVFGLALAALHGFVSSRGQGTL